MSSSESEKCSYDKKKMSKFQVAVLMCLSMAVLGLEAASFQYQRQTAYSPYPAAGYLPAGRQFELPERQSPVYGPPQDDLDATTTTEIPTTTESFTEMSQNLEKEEEDVESVDGGSDEAPEQEGVYYIYHPHGLLQRVAYKTKNDAEKMELVAQLNFRDVQPIKDPIYTYDPKTFAFQQITA